MSLITLPYEILCLIAVHLPNQARQTFACLAKFTHKVLNDEKTWRLKYIQDLGTIPQLSQVSYRDQYTLDSLLRSIREKGQKELANMLFAITRIANNPQAVCATPVSVVPIFVRTLKLVSAEPLTLIPTKGNQDEFMISKDIMITLTWRGTNPLFYRIFICEHQRINHLYVDYPHDVNNLPASKMINADLKDIQDLRRYIHQALSQGYWPINGPARLTVKDKESLRFFQVTEKAM